MKKETKKAIIIGISVLVFLVIVFISQEKKNQQCGEAGISLEEFEKIQIGDSNFDVDSIIDSDDKWRDDNTYKKCVQEFSKEEDDHIYHYTYKYIGENEGYALVTYTADYSNGDLFVLPTVSKKEQFNLK